MPRILAIDYGDARCGLAWTDPLRMFATGLPPCTRPELDNAVAELVRSGPVDTIVLGFPSRLDGSDTHATAAVRAYHLALQQRWPAIAIHLFDERFTSALAMQAMQQAGLSRKKRADKHLINSVSAVILLQNFLESPLNRPR